MRFSARDLLWVLPLTFFSAVGTIFSAAPEGAWRTARETRDGPRWSGGPPDLTGDLLVAVALAVVAALAQLAARARPATTLVGTGVLVGLYLALGFHDGPVFLVLVVSSFVAARHASLRTWAPSVTAALVAMLIGLTVREAGNGGLTASALWQASGTVGLTLACGLLGILLHNRREAALEREQHAVTAEQLRTAQDLHDGVGHGLAVIAMQSGVALHVLDRDPEAVRGALEAIRDTSRESLASLRSELTRMSGREAPRRPRSGLADLPALAARIEGAGVRVSLRDHAPSHVPDDVGSAVYAIAQESLTNVLRHADARHIDLELAADGDGVLCLVVRDDGTGGAVHHEGMGLVSMRDRAAAVGGSFSAGPRADGGFEVIAEFPLEAP